MRIAALAMITWLASSPTGIAGDTSSPTPSSEHETVIGITMPFRRATLAVVQPGRIARIAIPEGTLVREGELVFALDDGVQQARTEIAKASAESLLEMKLAYARWEKAKRDLGRLTGLYGSDSASSKEVSDALAEESITRLEYELAVFGHDQADRAHEREHRLLLEFRAVAPFTGYVTEHLKHVGESVDESDGLVELVQLDPLKISVDCPLALAPSVHPGDQLWVRPVDPQWGPRLGTVVMAGRVADAASQTFKVKLTVDNQDAGWMAGLKVSVDFPKNVVPRPQLGSSLPASTVSASDGPQREPPTDPQRP